EDRKTAHPSILDFCLLCVSVPLWLILLHLPYAAAAASPDCAALRALGARNALSFASTARGPSPSSRATRPWIISSRTFTSSLLRASSLLASGRNTMLATNAP